MDPNGREPQDDPKDSTSPCEDLTGCTSVVPEEDYSRRLLERAIDYFRRFTEILVEEEKNFEEKFEDSNFNLKNANDEFLHLMQNTEECIVALRNSYLRSRNNAAEQRVMTCVPVPLSPVVDANVGENEQESMTFGETRQSLNDDVNGSGENSLVAPIEDQESISAIEEEGNPLLAPVEAQSLNEDVNAEENSLVAPIEDQESMSAIEEEESSLLAPVEAQSLNEDINGSEENSLVAPIEDQESMSAIEEEECSLLAPVEAQSLNEDINGSEENSLVDPIEDQESMSAIDEEECSLLAPVEAQSLNEDINGSEENSLVDPIEDQESISAIEEEGSSLPAPVEAQKLMGEVPNSAGKIEQNSVFSVPLLPPFINKSCGDTGIPSDKNLKRNLPLSLDEIDESEIASIRKKQKIEQVEEVEQKEDDEALYPVELPRSKINGRKDIKNVKEETMETKKVAREEKARQKRLAKRQESLEEIFGTPDPSRNVKFVLDYDVKTKKELVVVNPILVRKLKNHQINGVRFMWNACFESLKEIKKGYASGCILAHCMGLGKTLQVITLVHTLLSYKETRVRTVLVICPNSTVLNWIDEFNKWLDGLENKDDIKVYDLTKHKGDPARAKSLHYWASTGGVTIVNYELFRSLVKSTDKQIIEALFNPGPNLVVCDEGHLLKNETSQMSQSVQRIKTKRRILLTGTPLQNNLNEFFNLVQLVRHNLLGTKEEYKNRYTNPIVNGQFADSQESDVKLMRNQCYCLSLKCKGVVQRYGYGRLQSLLPPKYEFVVSVALADLQAALYKHYLENEVIRTNLFADYHALHHIWTHPLVIKLRENGNGVPTEDNPEENGRKTRKSSARGNKKKNDSLWWRKFVSDRDLEDPSSGPKLLLLFAILKYCEEIREKVLVFSSSIPTLDLIEYFLVKQDKNSGQWKKNLDYFRMDSKATTEQRAKNCNSFNNPDNIRARLFLISVKTGALGINLHGANRVVLFDTSWNPSDDSQSIYRVYRFGQTKPCFVYRLVSNGTMEEKIYERQVTKLSVSCRVVDDQQISRHYSQEDISQLYSFERKPRTDKILKLPDDQLMVHLLQNFKDIIIDYHEHDSLLEHVAKEELTDEERKAALLNDENDSTLKLEVSNVQVARENEHKPYEDQIMSENECNMDESTLIYECNRDKSITSDLNETDGYLSILENDSTCYLSAISTPLKQVTVANSSSEVESSSKIVESEVQSLLQTTFCSSSTTDKESSKVDSIINTAEAERLPNYQIASVDCEVSSTSSGEVPLPEISDLDSTLSDNNSVPTPYNKRSSQYCAPTCAPS